MAVTEWQFCSRFFKKRLIDGSYANGRLMRRKINGEWQYRKLTDDEEGDEFERMAW